MEKAVTSIESSRATDTRYGTLPILFFSTRRAWPVVSTFSHDLEQSCSLGVPLASV